MPDRPDPTNETPPPAARALGLSVLALVLAGLVAWVLLRNDEGPARRSGPVSPAATTPAGADRTPGRDTTTDPFAPPGLPVVGADGDASGDGPPGARASLRGVVIHSDGSPAASGRVVASDGVRTRERPVAAGGAFAFEALPAGRWMLYADVEGLREAVPVPVVLEAGASVGDVVVTLQGRSALDVTVRDARSLESLSACRAGIGASATVACGADGRVTLGPRASGPASLVVEAPGFATRVLQVTFPASGRASLDVHLSGGVSMSGLVRTPEGRPVEAAAISVARWSMAGGEAARGPVDPVTASDADGKFVLAGITPGRIAACARVEGFATACSDERYVPVGGGREGIELVMRTGGAIAGRVVAEGGVGVPGASLVLADLRARREAGAAAGLDDGSFRFDAVAPGTYTIEARTASGRGLANGVVVVDREETEVELLLGDEALRGRVTFADGSPAPGAAVRISPAAVEGRPDSTTTDADGRFERSGLVGGPYLVRASHPNGGEAEQRGVAAGSEVTLVLADTGAIEGVVLDADGRPVTDFQLTLVPDSGSTAGPVAAGYRRSAIATSDGSFAERALPVGRYSVRVGTAAAPGAVREAAVKAGETTRVEFTLEAGVTVSGTTTLDGVPRAGCRVSEVRRGRGRVEGMDRIVTTREDGRFTLAGVARGRTGLSANCGDDVVGLRWIDTSAEPTSGLTLELTTRKPRDTAPDDGTPDPEFGGIGLSLGQDRDGRAFVRWTSEGGPAFLAGIGRGDTIVRVDGWPVQGRSMEEIVMRVRGPVGTSVSLELRRDGTGAPYATVVPRVRIVAGGP